MFKDWKVIFNAKKGSPGYERGTTLKEKITIEVKAETRRLAVVYAAQFLDINPFNYVRTTIDIQIERAANKENGGN